MWNNTNSKYGQSEKNRRLAREAEHKRNFFLGLILAPVIFVGWVPIVWIASKLIK